MATTTTTTRKWSTRGAWGATTSAAEAREAREADGATAHQRRAAATTCHYCGGTVRRSECTQCGESHETY